MIAIIDFGSQTTHLISRRLKDLGVPSHLVVPEEAIEKIAELKPQGVILSGGPASVYEDEAPTISTEIYELGLPILGICYGLQLSAKLLGGKVISGKKEYGPAQLKIANNNKSQITKGLPKHFTVWMSHGDEVVAVPKSFDTVGSTEHVPYAFTVDEDKKIYGVQFHPEVEHTQYGNLILENFIRICSLETKTYTIDVKKLEQNIKEVVGDAYVIGAVSGGVDSTVAGVLTAKAIGKKFIPIYVDNGLMRKGTTEHVKKIFNGIGIKPIIIEVEDEMLSRLKGKDDPEEKRKIIGKFYIELFEREMKRLEREGVHAKFLLQGTIYSDVIESKGTKYAAKIKSHHNVGGLPDEMNLKLLEPLRHFYKDEVRKIGAMLELPNDFVHRQVFPGPGYAIRIRGEVTKERLEKAKQADGIVTEELIKAGIYPKVYMSFPIMTGTQSTAVKGDGRFFGEVVALRIIESADIMTTKWAEVPYPILQKMSSRIVNEVPGISRVVYDITTKPPATMEWE